MVPARCRPAVVRRKRGKEYLGETEPPVAHRGRGPGADPVERRVLRLLRPRRRPAGVPCSPGLEEARADRGGTHAAARGRAAVEGAPESSKSLMFLLLL